MYTHPRSRRHGVLYECLKRGVLRVLLRWILKPKWRRQQGYYEIMGLEKTATHAEIRRAWKKLSLSSIPTSWRSVGKL